MSDSPIFHQLVSEFAAKGAVYEEFVRFTTPAFEWGPRYVVQLDKQPKKSDVKFSKPVPLSAKWIEFDDTAKKLLEGTRDDKPMVLRQHVETTVKPLSERNTAQPME